MQAYMNSRLECLVKRALAICLLEISNEPFKTSLASLGVPTVRKRIPE